ncbi:hypothetical protein [Zunongwangia sp.]|uniref:hypothetical protein n=1 Tax=Zunongwangia sp. TaxID=1965325 RepID=UPI003AA8A287
MKKLILLLVVAATTLVSCNDDDGPSIAYDYAKITGNNLPDYFEAGEEYEIKITYELPDACHNFYSIPNAQGYQNQDDDTMLIYDIAVQTSYDVNITECTEEDGTDLEETKVLASNYKLPSNTEFKTIRFRLLKGFNSSNEAEFTTVDVPVGAPEEDGSGDEGGTDDTENTGEEGNA